MSHSRYEEAERTARFLRRKKLWMTWATPGYGAQWKPSLLSDPSDDGSAGLLPGAPYAGERLPDHQPEGL